MDAMSMKVTSTIRGELTTAEALVILDDILCRHEGRKPRGMSNSLHQRGIPGELRGILVGANSEDAREH